MEFRSFKLGKNVRTKDDDDEKRDKIKSKLKGNEINLV